MGLVIFGHGHSHSLPQLDEGDDNEDSSDDEDDPSRERVALRVETIPSNGGATPAVSKTKLPASAGKKARCHILCRFNTKKPIGSPISMSFFSEVFKLKKIYIN